uniref:Animal hem peroxidase n=1 Tax=Angiostrongylus cantonensis TaxID=6313 RepID=A0A0K0DGA4_ANGCA
LSDPSHCFCNRVLTHTQSRKKFITSRKAVGTLIGPFHSRLVPPYVKYNPAVNPAVLNEFAAAAYRFHGMIQEFYPLIVPNFESRGQFPVLQWVNRIEVLLSAMDPLYRGLIATPARRPQRISTALTERLFGSTDMATVNIQRGRDHDLRPYNDYRRLCQLKPITSFDEWPEVTMEKVRERVAQLYPSPNDLDLYVGGIIEEPIDGSFVGPTFACIIAEQFVRLRDGDRFYYENEGVFTPAQVAALKAVTLSSVLCETVTRAGAIKTFIFPCYIQEWSNGLCSLRGLPEHHIFLLRFLRRTVTIK